MVKSTLEILKCKRCGRLAVAIADTRITEHKCTGEWTVIARELFNAETAVEALAKVLVES
jgi:hypothetical protein